MNLDKLMKYTLSAKFNEKGFSNFMSYVCMYLAEIYHI